MIFDVAFFMYGLVSLLGFFGYFYRPHRSERKAKNVEFVIPSTADNKTLNELKQTVKRIKQMFPDYKVWVVVDEGAKPQLPEEILLVTVPDNFSGMKKGKGRALEYFRRHYVKDDVWYVFLDDDSFPLDDLFLYEIPFYEEKGYGAGNGILLPRRGKSLLCFIVDQIRYWDDLFIFRLTTGVLSKPYVGFHGELLIVKGKVLNEIGFSDSITEDFRFSQMLIKKGYRVWQSRTLVSIKSPNSLRDLWKQRARWIKGIMLDLPTSSLITKIFIFMRLIGGITSSMIFCLFWFLLPPQTPFSLFGFFGLAYYLTAYAYGVIKSKKHIYLPFLPLFGLLEHISLLYLNKIKGFEVIDKN